MDQRPSRRKRTAAGVNITAGSQGIQMAEDDPESTFHLIDRARAGDHAALNRLFDRHLAPLRRWARGRLPRWARDLADTDDLVQETLLQTFKKIEDFEPRRVGALQAYLRQAVLNRIRDELRRKGRRPQAAELDGLEEDRAASPLEQAIGQEAIERYERALARLRPEEQEAVIGRVEMGYGYDELAEALGKPTADAARKAAERALVRLAEEMSHAD
jgi:RNA polymerase sigma-70 factor, ECF subfamily